MFIVLVCGNCFGRSAVNCTACIYSHKAAYCVFFDALVKVHSMSISGHIRDDSSVTAATRIPHPPDKNAPA